MIIESLKRKKNRMRRYYLHMSNGIITPLECVLGCIGQILGLVGIKQNYMESLLTKRRKKIHLDKDCYLIKDVKIPLLDLDDEYTFFLYVLDDVFYPYLYLKDNYDVGDAGFLDEIMPEGFYIYSDRTREIDLNLRPGDVVIDAGAWVGDFAAYASVKGAVTYAFEPLPKTFEILQKTSRLNKNIIPVSMGLGAHKEELTMMVKEHSSDSASLSLRRRGQAVKVQITTLDDFVEENKLERVDFIKADIEGHERFMLQGAKNTLKKFGPNLAICTYHLPDDPKVLENIIKEANPAYEVIQRNKKLFAYIP